MSAECCAAPGFRHVTGFPWWMKDKDNTICLQEKKGEVANYHCSVFYVGPLPRRGCCRLKAELYPTLKTKYWRKCLSFNSVTDTSQQGKVICT